MKNNQIVRSVEIAEHRVDSQGFLPKPTIWLFKAFVSMAPHTSISNCKYRHKTTVHGAQLSKHVMDQVLAPKLQCDYNLFLLIHLMKITVSLHSLIFTITTLTSMTD